MADKALRVSVLGAWGPAIAWCLLIFWLSSMSNPPQILPPFALQDKLLHGIEYGILAILLHRGLRRKGPAGSPSFYFALALGMASVYAASDETHQLFVPGRQADVWDWAADTVGAYLALWVCTRRSFRAGPS